MAKRSNPKLIGAFVIGAIALAIIGAIAFGGTQFLTEKRKVVMYFQGSVGGLAVGAPVNFRGVKIGKVTNITINYDIDQQVLNIPVIVEIQPSMLHVTRGKRDAEKNFHALIDRGMRAQLVVQSLVTGQASIELDFHPDTPVHLVGGTIDLPEVPTIPSSLDAMQANVADVLAKISKLPLEQIASELTIAIVNLQQTLNDAGALLKNVDTQIEPTLANLQGASEGMRQAVDAANARLSLNNGEPLQTLNSTLKDYGNLANQLQGKTSAIAGDLQKTLEVMNATLTQIDDVSTLLERDLAKNPALLSETTSTLREFKAMASSIRAFADYLQRNPNALLMGKR
jgi:paraquat-inducible protein B